MAMISRFHMLLALVVLVCAGCPDRKEKANRATSGGRLVVDAIKIHITADQRLEAPSLTRQEVDALVRSRLGKADVVRLVEGEAEARGAYKLVLEMAVARAAPGAGLKGPAAVVACQASVPGDLDAVVLRAQAVGALGRSLARANVKKTLHRLLDAVLDDIIYQAGLAVADGETLGKELRKATDLQRLVPAVEIAGRRKLSETLPALIALLDHKEQTVSHSAVGALVALGDRRAVPPLTRLSKFSDTARLARILDAIASLGGDEAVSYLEFVASGHEDEDIRFMATEALERMKRLAK